MDRKNNVQKANEEEMIDLTAFVVDFFKMLRRTWKLLVVFGVIGALIFGLRANMTYKPKYTASATFTINIYEEQADGSIINSSFFDNSAAEQMATTFPHILTSGVLQRKVAKDLSMSSMTGSIKAEVAENTNLLTLSVTDIDAQRAYRTLQAVVKNYPSVSELIVGKVNMEMLDETGIPTKPDNPKNLKRSIAKGGIAGVAAGLLLIAFMALTNRTIRREEDCIKRINMKCLGNVPRLQRKARSRKSDYPKNITEEKISQEFVESFRIIRNKVEYSAHENDLKSILITSALADEGKSTVAVNLALSLVQNGKKTALVDCDLRNPSDSNILKIENEKGLAEYLKGEIELEESMSSVEKEGLMEPKKFMYVPGGAAGSDSTELLDNPKMETLINSLESKAEYIILDSAPIGLLADAGILSQYVDGIILVVKKDYARADFIMNCLEQLKEYHVHIIGCVLND